MIVRKFNIVEWLVLATSIAMLAIATKLSIETLIKFTCEFPWFF